MHSMLTGMRDTRCWVCVHTVVCPFPIEGYSLQKSEDKLPMHPAQISGNLRTVCATARPQIIINTDFGSVDGRFLTLANI